MNHRLVLISIVSVLVILASGCKALGLSPEPTPTPTETLIPATSTLPPPSATPIPPTSTPLPPTPTIDFTLAAPPTFTHTPTVVLLPTKIVPLAGALFVGEFSGGVFSFRVNDKSTYVTLKEILVTKAQCGKGKNITDHLVFNPVYFRIEEGRFTISLPQATVTGLFLSSKIATGTITVEFMAEKVTCTVGPATWQAEVRQ